MSKADKMFEKLNCIKNYEDENIIKYITSVGAFIIFEKYARLVKIYGNPYLDIQEIQAINEKCKELGWLDKERNE